MYQDQTGSVDTNTNVVVTTETISGGVIKTTTTTTTTDTIVLDRSHRTDTQDVILKSWGPLKVYIYTH